MERIYEADAFVDGEVELDAQAEESLDLAPEIGMPAFGEEKDLAELTVYYPSDVCHVEGGKTETVYVPMSLIGAEVVPASAPVKLPEVKPVVIAPVAEDPALAEKAKAMRERLAAIREKIYASAAVEEAPAEEPETLVEAAEEIIEQSEPALVAVPAVEEAAPVETAPVEEESAEEEINPFVGIQSRTFEEKLATLPEAMRRRYDALNAYLATYERMRVVTGKKYRTYKSGNVAFLKMAIRGKTLSAYFALDPKEYEESKYVFTNEGESAAYENYPMRLRLSSDRQERWCEELVDVIAEKNGIQKLPAEVVAELKEESEEGPFDPFAALKRKKQKTFKQRLRAGSPALRARYKAIKAKLSEIDRIRIIESNKSETYKRGSKPIAKLTVKGKTLNAYLALPPSEYAETKYIFVDASEIKAYEKYPMRVKISSDRQEKWTKELVDEIIAREGLKTK
jgi:predicted transport protein